MAALTRLRVAMLGCGARGRSVYLPVIRKMDRHFALVGVCDRDGARAAAMGAEAGVASFGSLDALVAACAPDLLIVAVTPPPSDQNEQATIAAIEAGVPLLAETPIASTMAGADRVLQAATQHQAIIEYGENYFRTPRERLVAKLLREGVFGNVNVAYSDFVGHGYHGVSLLRSQIGFDVPVTSVIGLAREYPVEEHLYRPGEPRRSRETWQFAALEFANGAHGMLSFSTLAYGSPLRWGREKAMVRFYAERGMRFGAELAVLVDAERTLPLTVVEIRHQVEGQTVLAALRANGPLPVTWENPLRDYALADGDQHSELTIGLQCLSAYRAITSPAPPEYGVHEAYYDRHIDFMIDESRRRGGVRMSVAAAPASTGHSVT